MERIGYTDALHDQPANLELARQTISRALAEAPVVPWKPGETVAIVAMGASSHSAHALAFALSAAGVRASVLTASDVELFAAAGQPADHYVLVSESGRSPEPIAAAERFTVGRRIGITNVADSPLSNVVDVVVPLGGFDDSGVYTIGYTSTLLAYSLLMRSAGLAPEGDPEAVPRLVEAALSDFDPLARAFADGLADAEAVDFVGRGMSLAAASEGALVFREALALPTAAFDTYQYLHGPMEGLRAGSGLVVFGDERELTMVDSVLDAGVKVCLVTARGKEELARGDHDGLTVVTLPSEARGFARSIVEVLIPQLVAEHRAEAIGRVPGRTFHFHQDDTKLPVG